MNLLKGLESKFWTYYFTKKYGFDPIHAELKSSNWTIAVWKKDEVLGSIDMPRDEHDGRLTASLERLCLEYKTKPKASIRPRSIQANIFGYFQQNLAEIMLQHKRNILVNEGMTRSGKLNTGESALSWTHIAVGRSNTGETVGDTNLTTEEKRKPFSSGGNRITVNQTEKYSMVWYDTDMVSALPVTLKEAGIFDQLAVSGDTMYCHVTYADKIINTGDLMTTQINVTHVNGTVT